jgi:hypothetical protein
MDSPSHIYFLNTINDFPQKFRELLITEFHRVVSEMPARRAEILKAYQYVPGKVLQRSPANTYSNGYFIVYWAENELELYHPKEVLEFLQVQESNE